MNPRHCIRLATARFCAAALLCVSAGAAAQAIYSKVDAGGHMTFSDLPFEAPDPLAETAPADARPRTMVGTMRNGTRRAAVVNAAEAERRLAQSQLKRQRGLAPLPGERGLGSGSHMNYRYWKRQERLRLEVEQAQRRLNHVQLPLLARR